MNKYFYTLEGGEGSGKSTVAKEVAKELKKLNIESIVTREPGGDKIAEQIRQLIFDNELNAKTEVLLFAASRKEHLDNVIVKSLNEKKIVLCDRYVDSSYAYQSISGEVTLEEIKEINNFVIENLYPTRTFFLDITPQEALPRLNKDEREITRFDLKELDFHQKVYENYKQLSNEYKGRYYCIDGTKTVQEIKEEIVNVILGDLKNV